MHGLARTARIGYKHPRLMEVRESHLRELEAFGIAAADFDEQLALLRGGARPARLDRPATLGDGVQQLDPGESHRYVALADAAANEGRLMKFVPASGAATRMFRELFEALHEYEANGTFGSHATAVERLFQARERFAFSDAINVASDDGSRAECLQSLLKSDLAAARLPKALLPFHVRDGSTSTALADHLAEAVAYGASEEGVVHVHFTIAEEHRASAREEADRVTARLASGGVHARVTFSTQSHATDTVALTGSGDLLRDHEGRIVLRPGGHGALLRNLQETRGDVLLVRNIDNIAWQLDGTPMLWRKRLIGYFVQLQQGVRSAIHALRDRTIDAEQLATIEARLLALDLALPQLSGDVAQRARQLLEAIDRPLRVAGVVRNEGQPGGGPFWASRAGTPTLQIVESAEVDFSDAQQTEIWSRATHFNPVELLCGLRDADDQPYDLARFTDPTAAFVTTKTHEGRPIRVLERPGLWNGAMAGWLTVFVEIPSFLFNPVKTVFDLLNPGHQPGTQY